MNQRMSAMDWALLVVLSLVWGGSFFFFEVALRTLPPFTVVLGRVGIAALVLLVIARLRGEDLPTAPRVLADYALLGAVSNAIPFSLIVWGQTQIPSGLASILNAMTPVFAVLVGLVIGRDERLTPARAAGVALGFAGVAVLMGPDLLRRLDPYSLGQLAVLGAACSYGVAVHVGRRFGGASPLVNAAYMLAASSLLLLPLTLAVDRPWTLAPGTSGWAALLGLSLLCTAFAYLLYFRILASAGATNMSLVTFLVPVSAISLGALFLGERLGPTAFAGLAIIFTGLAVMDGRIAERLRRRRPLAAGPDKSP